MPDDLRYSAAGGCDHRDSVAEGIENRRAESFLGRSDEEHIDLAEDVGDVVAVPRQENVRAEAPLVDLPLQLISPCTVADDEETCRRTGVHEPCGRLEKRAMVLVRRDGGDVGHDPVLRREVILPVQDPVIGGVTKSRRIDPAVNGPAHARIAQKGLKHLAGPVGNADDPPYAAVVELEAGQGVAAHREIDPPVQHQRRAAAEDVRPDADRVRMAGMQVNQINRLVTAQAADRPRRCEIELVGEGERRMGDPFPLAVAFERGPSPAGDEAVGAHARGFADQVGDLLFSAAPGPLGAQMQDPHGRRS